MLNQILRKIKFFDQNINQQNKYNCSRSKQIRLLGTAAIVLGCSVGVQAGKVSMMLNGVPQGDYLVLREAAEAKAKLATSTSTEGDTRVPGTTPQPLPRGSLIEAKATEEATKLYNKAYELKKQKDYAGAIELYAKAIELKPDFAESHYNRACALQDLGRIEEAQDGFRTAIGLNPEYRKQSRALKILQEAQDIAINEPMISVNVEQPKLSNITRSEGHEEVAKSLQQNKQSIIRSKGSTLAHYLASAGDHIRSGRLADATNSLDRSLDLLHDYPSLRGNETRDLETQTTLSMLKEATVSVQTEVQVKEAEVQVSSSMSSASAQTDSVPISSTFVQTDSSTIGATEIATQTSVASSSQAVQTLPAKISSTFTQTEALESKNTEVQTNYVAIRSTEQQVQTEANVINQDVQTDDIATNKHYSDSSTSTDDLLVLGADDSHSDILDWEVASHAGSESDASSYSEALVETSIASKEVEEEEGQVLSEASQQILSKDNSDFYKTVAEIDEMLASDLAEEATHVLEDNNNNFPLQRLPSLESEKAMLASASMELASHSTRNMTGSIISDIDKRLKSAFSLPVVSAGEEDEQRGNGIVGGSSGFYISPFIGKAKWQERASRSGYHSKTRGAIIGYDLRINDSILLGLNFTKADSQINFRNNKLGDKASVSSNLYSLYGLYTLVNQNIFISTIGIYGISDIKSSAKRPDSEIATGNHKAYSNIMQVMFGYNYKPITSLSIKPVFGIKYSKIRDASYQEYGAGSYNLALSGTKALELETITGLKLSNNSILTSGISITAEIHCFLHKNIKSKNPNITAKFLDKGALLSSGPIHRSKLSLSYGAGLNIAAKKNLEIGLFYNGNKASKYMSHAGSLKLKINL